MGPKPAITKVEYDAIAGIFIALGFYADHRHVYPTSIDMIEALMPNITEEDINKFREAAAEAARCSLKSVNVVNKMYEATGKVMPPEDEQIKVIKQLAAAHGMITVNEARDIVISDKIYQMLSAMVVEYLWKEILPTEEVLCAIFLEGLALTILGMEAWGMAEGSPMAERINEEIKKRFLIMPEKASFSFRI